jgi:hypothetical protein
MSDSPSKVKTKAQLKEEQRNAENSKMLADIKARRKRRARARAKRGWQPYAQR